MPGRVSAQGHEVRVRQRLTGSTNIDEHVFEIKRMLDRSLVDAETRQLAVRIVSGAYDYITAPNGEQVAVVRAYGRNFRAPPGRPCEQRDEECEIEKIWDFVVLNFRYVYDPADIDTFATARESLLAGGGDCDDATILFAALLGLIGFRVIGRVVSTVDDPNTWVHIYPMVAVSKDHPEKWVALDCTVAGALPGWEYPEIAHARDYVLV